MDNPFDAIRKRTDAIMQDRIDQEWIEREHEHHLRSQSLPLSKETSCLGNVLVVPATVATLSIVTAVTNPAPSKENPNGT
jgi:hypothetical protein